MRLTILISATIATIAAAYIYRPFDPDYIQIGVMALVSLVFTATYLKIRKNIKAKAASSAVRRSAGSAGIKKFDRKMLNVGIIVSALLLTALKGYIFLIPMGIIIISYLLYRIFNVRVMALLGYVAAVFITVGFTFPFILSLSTAYSLIIEGGVVISFLLVSIPEADLFCIQ